MAVTNEDPVLASIAQQAQRQDSLRDQLEDLRVAATRLGMYDAADWLTAQLTRTDTTTD